jgi:hypothetical protein
VTAVHLNDFTPVVKWIAEYGEAKHMPRVGPQKEAKNRPETRFLAQLRPHSR